MIQTTVFDLIGSTDLLMNRYTGDEEKVKNFDKLTEEEAWGYARSHAYLDRAGAPFIPAENLVQCLIGGGKYVKGKGRGNLAKSVAAGMRITKPELPLITADGNPVAIELFRNMRKNPSTGGKMLNYRLRILAPWYSQMPLEWDDDLFQWQDVTDVVMAAGVRVGLMDWRPEKRGAFGQFRAQPQGGA